MFLFHCLKLNCLRIAYQMINQLRTHGVEPVAIEQALDLTIPENKIMLAFYLA
ncbi:Uncharacterised protein [Sphingobacterium daejeonense]|nr:Uncharacterised protein [Sphingobacterium daejeonense]